MCNTKIFIVCHKDIDLPNIKGYQIITPRVQNVVVKNAIYDDCGKDNISDKNPYYSELSSLYCIWKNLLDDTKKYYGLCHYRRFFGDCKMYKKSEILSVEQADKYLKKYDLIMPMKIFFTSDSVRKQLVDSSVDKENYIQIRKILQKMYPDYVKTYDEFMTGNSLSICNMFITNNILFNRYCEWLFSFLFELEKHIVIDESDEYKKRFFGYISERLLNVWVIHNKYKVKYLPIVDSNGNGFFYDPARELKSNLSTYFLKKRFKKNKMYLSDDLD